MRINSVFKNACIAGSVFVAGFLVSSDTDLNDITLLSANVEKAVSVEQQKPAAPVRKIKTVIEEKKPEPVIAPGLFLQLDSRNDEIKRYKEFCQENPGDCDFPLSGKSAVHMDDNLMRLLNTVNTSVNNAVKYEEDSVVYGVGSKWNIPKHEEGAVLRGDCEDYSLQKRKILLDYLPPESMMVAIVAFDDTQTHAILVVRTTQGDYILDNARKDIRLARDTGYRFMFASNPGNDRKWSGATIFSSQTDEDARNMYVATAVTVTRHIPDENAVRLAMGVMPLQVPPTQLATAAGVLASPPGP